MKRVAKLNKRCLSNRGYNKKIALKTRGGSIFGKAWSSIKKIGKKISKPLEKVVNKIGDIPIVGEIAKDAVDKVLPKESRDKIVAQAKRVDEYIKDVDMVADKLSKEGKAKAKKEVEKVKKTVKDTI